ncbi:MAG: CRISPR-associated ring nuclease Csm6 [Sutterella sp.]|nr:CRISPR-associated ring nuclease Csm6 [Sutterella sp.]
MTEPDRRIFVSVTGMTPQVVTETLYALVTQDHAVPTEIHLITTANGRNRALRDLLDSQTGQFHAFCRDYDLVGRIRFDDSMIHVICDANGHPLSDIRTQDDNTQAADLIVRLMQQFCSDSEASVHVSLAGGRKTMSFFVGYALSLFGRSQDRLSHVLVSEPYENNRDFFYPTQIPHTIFNHSGEALDAQSAKIALADIPFVRLRNGLPETLLTGKVGYSETVRVAQNRIVPPVSVSFDSEKRLVLCGMRPVRMSPCLFAMYLWLAIRCKEKAPAVRPGTNAQAEEFLRVYKRIAGQTGDYDNAVAALRHDGDFLPYFQEKRSLIHRQIRAELGASSAVPYLIQSLVKRLDTRYTLKLSPKEITLPSQVCYLSQAIRKRL